MKIIYQGNKQIQKQNYLNKIKHEKSFLKKVILYCKMRIHMSTDKFDQRNFILKF